jgi:hypothetical protein
LNYEKLKNGLCGAMSHEPWQSAFAGSNEELASNMQGAMEKTWWPVIPPQDWIKDNTDDINGFLSCNISCLKGLIDTMKQSDNLDATVYVQNYTANLNALESVDFKSELDVEIEGIATKEGDPLVLFNEMISVEKMSPIMLKTLLE